MKAGLSLALVVALAASSAGAQTITDGDTIKQGGVTYRLWGIDAPEAKQVCPDGWPAGRMATTRLLELTAGRQVICQEKDRYRYGRIVAICRTSGEDLGAILVREGLAWAFVRHDRSSKQFGHFCRSAHNEDHQGRQDYRLDRCNTVEIESCKRLEHCWRGTMRPFISRLELVQFLRLLFVAALLLGGIGVAIGGGSSALELIAMR